MLRVDTLQHEVSALAPNPDMSSCDYLPYLQREVGAVALAPQPSPQPVHDGCARQTRLHIVTTASPLTQDLAAGNEHLSAQAILL